MRFRTDFLSAVTNWPTRSSCRNTSESARRKPSCTATSRCESVSALDPLAYPRLGRQPEQLLARKRPSFPIHQHDKLDGFLPCHKLSVISSWRVIGHTLP